MRAGTTRVALVAVLTVVAVLGPIGVSDASAAVPGGAFVGLTPTRLLDTRTNGQGPCLPGAATRRLTVGDRGGVPANAAAAVLNVTVTDPTGDGFVTVFPSGVVRPLASNLNFAAGQTVPNSVTVKIGHTGQVSLYNGSLGCTHVIIDVVGYYAGGSVIGGGFTGVTPTRVRDTRETGGCLAGPVTRQVQVTGVGGLPASASAVVLNVTAVAPSAGGFLTVYPSGVARPLASSLNFLASQIVPNAVVAELGANGAIEVYNGSPGCTHVVVDVVGYFTAGTPGAGALDGVTPLRVRDTREVGGCLASGETRTVQVAGFGTIPGSALAVALNVTVVDPTGPGFLTVFPAGVSRPLASSLNFSSGQVVANSVQARVGSAGAVSVFNGSSGCIHVVIDVVGHFSAGTPTPTLSSMSTSSGSTNGDTQVELSGTDLADATEVRFGDQAVSSFTVVSPTMLRATAPAAAAGTVDVVVSTPGGSTAKTPSTRFTYSQPKPTVSSVTPPTGFISGGTVVSIVGSGFSGTTSVRFGSTAASTTVLGANLIRAIAPPGSPGVLDVTVTTPLGTSPVTARSKFTYVAPPAGAPTGPLLRDETLSQSTSNGTERVALWVCDVPIDSTAPEYVGTTRQSVDAAAAAAFANNQVSSWFATSSRGRFQVTFTSLGRISLGMDENRDTCLAQARARTTPPYTNIAITDTTTTYSGVASPGFMGVGGWGYLGHVLGDDPSLSGRYLRVDGGGFGAMPFNGLVIHELGHTLHWPHSFFGPGEYDNPVDPMSGPGPVAKCNAATPRVCTTAHTLAMNRWASGWIDAEDVRVHSGGTTTVDLAAPERDGVQMLVAPADIGLMLTAEARPAIGFDTALPSNGVVLHVVDQRPSACESTWLPYCVSMDRRMKPALGTSGSTQHVLGTGQTVVTHGVTVTVLAATADGYQVQMSGTFQP